jgi:hypothetical protein
MSSSLDRLAIPEENGTGGSDSESYAQFGVHLFSRPGRGRGYLDHSRDRTSRAALHRKIRLELRASRPSRPPMKDWKDFSSRSLGLCILLLARRIRSPVKEDQTNNRRLIEDAS